MKILDTSQSTCMTIQINWRLRSLLAIGVFGVGSCELMLGVFLEVAINWLIRSVI